MTLKMMSIMFLASPHSATLTLTIQVGCCIVANGMLGLIKLAGRSYTNLSLHARCLTLGIESLSPNKITAQSVQLSR